MQFIFIHTTNMHRHKSNRSFKKIVNRVRSKLLAYNGLTKNDAENAQKQASSPPKIKKNPRITNARSIVLTEDESTWVSETNDGGMNRLGVDCCDLQVEMSRSASPAPCKNLKNRSCDGKIMSSAGAM